MKNQTTKSSSHSSKTSSTLVYESNPFYLSVRALERLFKSNTWWGVALLAIGWFGYDNSRMDGSNNLSHNGLSMNNIVLPNMYTIASVFFVLLGALLLVIVLTTFLQGIFSYIALQSEKGKTVSINEAFEATKLRFSRLFLANALAFIKIVLWSLLFIIPGIVAAFRYALLSYVVMDDSSNNKSIRSTHERVKSITKNRLIEVFGLITLSSIIPFIGNALQVSGGAAQYRQLSSSFDNSTTRPPIHWVNYLGIVVIIVAAIITALIVMANV